MIEEILNTGKDNARTGRAICDQLNLDPRELTEIIEKERHAGAPICASCDRQNPGYYLAANKAEMQEYCDSLRHRAGRIHKTRRACLKAIERLPEAAAQ